MNEYQFTLANGWITSFYSEQLPAHLRSELSRGAWPKDDMTGEFYNPASIVKVEHVKYHPKKDG
jgi:hypothetical protein